MIYCDLSVDSTVVWAGVRCLDRVDIKSQPYIPFLGSLFFIDTHGDTDPEWQGLGGRYALAYTPPDGSASLEVPMQPEPSQTLNIVLYGQNCTFAFYFRETL